MAWVFATLGSRWSLPVAGAALLVLATALSAADKPGGLRTFTDTQGRSIQAELVSASRETVRLRRDDGREFEVALATLSEADRRHIGDWTIRRALAEGLIVVRSHRVRLESKSTRTKSSSTRDDLWCYTIAVENRSPHPIDGLTVEFRVFFTDDKADANPARLPLQRIAGSTALGIIEPGRTVEIRTAPVRLRSSELKPGKTYPGTRRNRIEDELRGLWLRVLRQGEIVHESASPSALARTERW